MVMLLEGRHLHFFVYKKARPLQFENNVTYNEMLLPLSRPTKSRGKNAHTFQNEA